MDEERARYIIWLLTNSPLRIAFDLTFLAAGLWVVWFKRKNRK